MLETAPWTVESQSCAWETIRSNTTKAYRPRHPCEALGQVASHRLPRRPKLLTGLGQIEIPRHADKRTQHRDGHAVGAFGLIHVVSWVAEMPFGTMYRA